MSDFAEAWARHRAGHRPLGWELRNHGAAHWVRFHSLPLSKRYPDTPKELEVVLERQNLLASTVLGDTPAWLVQSLWDGPGPVATHVQDYRLELAFRFVVEPDTEDASDWSAYAAQVKWASHKFDDRLIDIAEDQAASTLWMSDSDGAIFAPYDGGVDLFLPTAQAVINLKRAHPDWLSSHPAGL